MSARIKVRNGRATVTYPPGRPPAQPKQRTFYKGRLAVAAEGRKLAAQLPPEERDRLGRRSPRMLPRGVREQRALAEQARREDVEKSGFYAGRIKT